MRYLYTIGCFAALLPICAWAGPAAADRNFSQYPGFAEYFAANPPAESAGRADRALARRHAPRFHLPAGHEGPIDFYRDYIAHGTGAFPACLRLSTSTSWNATSVRRRQSPNSTRRTAHKGQLPLATTWVTTSIRPRYRRRNGVLGDALPDDCR